MSGSTKTEGITGNLTVKRPAKVTQRNTAAQPAKRPRAKERSGGKPKPEKLVCRYCGGDDLSPSFIKRRDRRCRKCFSKRYGSVVQGKKTGKKR